VRQLIRKTIKEQTEQDMGPAIKELLSISLVPNYKNIICDIDVVAPWNRKPIGSFSEFKDYQIIVKVIGGVDSKRWPVTQYVRKEDDKIVNDVWHTVYNFLGASTDIFLKNVKSCDEVMGESTIPNTVKRRANQQTLEKYITKGEINYPTLCDDFEDGYEYADAVIDYAIDEFIGEFDEDIDEEDYHSDVMDYLRTVCRDKFGKYLIDIYEMTCPEEDINESKITESPNERLEKLIGNYITMSYPTAQKIRLAPPGVNGSITTFTLPNPEDERDNLIFKFDVFGKPEYNINPEFFSSIDSMFGKKKNVRKIILKWFEDKEIDVDLVKNSDTNKQEQNESELTERCWKGYTQKGMKTMFGKRYPNCVKIKKKSVNESKMLEYLKQFLSGEVLDNYRKEKGRKEFQKMVDMVYKITAKDNPIEGMVGVLVGSIDKSMWGQSFNDPNSVGARWDFTVILKPLFTNYNPNNDPDYNERVLNFEKEFNTNARGMGFELISPIQHEKVKQYKVTFEWTSRLDVKEI
jgi:hypothetical protein